MSPLPIVSVAVAIGAGGATLLAGGHAWPWPAIWGGLAGLHVGMLVWGFASTVQWITEILEERK